MTKKNIKFIVFFIILLILNLTNVDSWAKIREPAVAGQFYPNPPQELKTAVNNYLDSAAPSPLDGELKGFISPHAGYIFSAPVAAYGYKLLIGKDIKRVILLGVAHRAPVKNASIYDGDAYRTPLGEVPLDLDAISQLKSKVEGIEYNPRAEELEHSLEVQLPFLQVVLPAGFKIVPILMGQPSKEFIETLSEQLAPLLEDPHTILIASTDLSHYLTYQEANSTDQKTLDLILANDFTQLYDTISSQQWACGAGGVLTLMKTAQKCAATERKLLKYANSGDTYGDKTRVVGYGSIAFYKPIKKENNTAKLEEVKKDQEEAVKMSASLNPEQRKTLLDIARQSIATKFEKKSYKPQVSDPRLLEPAGAFVTLKTKGELRGCIGRFEPDEALCNIVAQMAREAAFQDFRFSPLQPSELEKVDIEISVLSPLEKITDPNIIEVGKHGIYIIRGYNRGVLLPQVATEWGWDRDTFLQHTCQKAGLPSNCWKEEGTEILVFTAEVFGEKENH